MVGEIHTQISNRPDSSRSRTLPPRDLQILTQGSSDLRGSYKAAGGHGEVAGAANMAWVSCGWWSETMRSPWPL